ncbi:ABC transporter ATP-binding protein [Citricoccus sp. GCM10030269]|uniref:ABC transporter ATP-binding protein n=1 Tax=Citricoccus sp. GCM10030269 TaxID=3273388 RepID=UPI00361FEA46
MTTSIDAGNGNETGTRNGTGTGTGQANAAPARARERDLRAEALDVGYGDRHVLTGLDIQIEPGTVTSIVGANASGKSTLLRTLSRLLTPMGGQVLLDGRSVHSLPSKELARVLGLLPQSPLSPDGITVSDLVGRGRHPHQRLFRAWSAADDAAVADALDATDTAELADRPVDELSGGQRQRVWIAMVLAQQTDVLLLDEPTTFLDVSHQIEVLDLLADLNHDRGTTIVMVLHDLNLAARYSDRLVALEVGGVYASGPADVVLTEQCVYDVFGLRSRIITDPVSGVPMVVPVGRHRTGPQPR